LANADQAGTISAQNFYANLNINNMERFVILMDEWHDLPAIDEAGHSAGTNTIANTTSGSLAINRFIPLKKLEQVYGATQSPMVIGNINTGALYLLGIGSPAHGTEAWAAGGVARLRFYDY